MKMAALAAVLSTGIAACSSDDDSDNSVVTGSQTALDQACNDWKTARANWENTEAFLFGAADVYSIDPHTDTWPVAANDLADVLRDEKAMANLDNFIKTANAGILGYHGLEYVLFRQGLPRKIDQITNLEYNYICAVAKDLYHATATLEAAWDSKESNAERQRIAKEYVATHLAIDDDGNQEGALDGFQNFGKAFKNPGTGDWETALDATREIISGHCPGSGCFRLRPDRGRLHFPSGTGAFSASKTWTAGTGNATLTAQANEVTAKLDAALDKIKAMKAPFALYYTDGSCKVAIDALGELDDALGALDETLAKFAGNATVETQCKVINENYVDNVVVATYRTLADNAQKLYQSIVNIRK